MEILFHPVNLGLYSCHARLRTVSCHRYPRKTLPAKGGHEFGKSERYAARRAIERANEGFASAQNLPGI